MSEKALYPLTGSMVTLGVFIMMYSLHAGSPFMFLQGLFLFWTGCKITMDIWKHQRLDM